jgi:hypothetical protein
VNNAALQNKPVTNGIERTCAAKQLQKFHRGTNYNTKIQTGFGA